MLLATCCVLLVGLLWWLRQRGGRIRTMLARFPGPPGVPILGNALDLGTTTSDFHSSVERFCKEYRGSAFRGWLGPMPFIFLQEPEDIEIILGSNKLIDKAELYKYLLPWLGTGLLTSTGSKWRRRRKIITPTFHFKILEEFIDVFNANGEILVEKLKKEVDGPGFDVYNYVTLYALDNICETAMGVTVNAQHNSESEYIQAIRDISDVIVKRTTKPLLILDFTFNLTKYKGIHDRALKILHDTTNKVISARRGEMKSTSGRGDRGAAAVQDDGVKRRLAFLDMLIESTHEGSLLTDEDIREEVDTFMFEGHDTTSSGITFTLWLLSRHPDVQDKVLEELEETFPDPEEPLSFRGLQELKYLERVIKESLRLYPSVPMYARELKEDVELSGGLVAPKGATVSIVAFMSQKHPDFFPDPERFDPDRFLPDNVQGRHPYAFVPFSAGPRNCVGQKFAMLELKSAVAHVVRNFKLLPGTDTPDLLLANELILVSKTGVKVKIAARNRAKCALAQRTTELQDAKLHFVRDT